MPSSRVVLAFAALFAGARSFQVRPETNRFQEEAVCISISVYEEPAWVDLLIANVLRFSERSTKIAIHLNREIAYDEADINRWRTARTAVTEQRVIVRPFAGSVLWSHLLNAETMAKEWGDVCKYFVLQASNMMWVRPGMEKQVRRRHFSPLGEHPRGDGCGYAGDTEWAKFGRRTVAPRNVYGHGQPEGSFFPLRHVLDLKAKLDNYIAHDLHGHSRPMIQASCLLENTWLQTYMLNNVDLPPVETFNDKGMEPLCLNAINNELGKSMDSVPLDKLRAVRAGATDYESYYAVKRVNRNVTHPVTKRILWMTRR